MSVLPNRRRWIRQALRAREPAMSALRRYSVLLLVCGSVPAGVCVAQVLASTATASFEALDTNKNGLVDKSEYLSSALFAKLDSNHNYKITADELEAVLGPQRDGAPSADDRIRQVDLNENGEISDEELRRAAEARFQQLDRNTDGNLDLAELKSGFGVPYVRP